MTDLVNQGKGSVMKIWKTNNETILKKIHRTCMRSGENFFNPTPEFKNKILETYNRKEN